jgi:hypothetical protein
LPATFSSVLPPGSFGAVLAKQAGWHWQNTRLADSDQLPSSRPASAPSPRIRALPKGNRKHGGVLVAGKAGAVALVVRASVTTPELSDWVMELHKRVQCVLLVACRV